MTAVEQPDLTRLHAALRATWHELRIAARAYHYGRHDQALHDRAPQLTIDRWLDAVDQAVRDDAVVFGPAQFGGLYDRLLAEKTRPAQKFVDVPLPLTGLPTPATEETDRDPQA